jgi:acyl-coenzyme A thioesterase PaaI-like protein
MEAPEQLELDHFVPYLGLDIWHEDTRTLGRAVITPQMLVSGTARLRLGLLFTMADVVAGNPSTGILSPTIDLRLQLLKPAPGAGEVLLEASPLKIGRRIWTGEVLCYGPDLFARSDYSFINSRLSGAPPHPGSRTGKPLPTPSFDELFQMRVRDGGAIEMDAHEAVRNGVAGTIQGGAQATMAEVAAETALACRGDYAVWDLSVRYLNTLKQGPAVACAQVLPGDDRHPVVRVVITDEGAGGRIVSTAVAVCRAASPDSGRHRSLA